MIDQQKIDTFANRMEAGKVTIFLFHGVIEAQTTQIRNYTRKHLLLEEFEYFLDQCLEQGGTPISLDQLITSQQGEFDLPEKPFAITFDDGFLNNLTVAAPALQSRKIPATYYIATDFIDSNRMSWIDRVEYVIEEVEAGSLDLPWGQRSFQDQNSKFELLNEIRREVKKSPDLDPDIFASNLQQQLGFEEIWSSAHPLDQKMTWEEVCILNKIEGMTIGGHTHNHAMLAFLDEEEMKAEIDLSLRLLNEKADIVSPHYSYPEGQAEHYNAQVITYLKAQGITCCPTAIDGINKPDADLFHLRRVMVQW